MWKFAILFIAAGNACQVTLPCCFTEQPSGASVTLQQTDCSITAQISKTWKAPAHTLWGTLSGYSLTWNDNTGGKGTATFHGSYIQFSNGGTWDENTHGVASAATGCPTDLAGSYDETPSHATVHIQQSGCSITAQITETSSAPAHTLWGTVTDDGYPYPMTWSDSTGQSGSAQVANEHATYIIQFSNNGEWVARNQLTQNTTLIQV